MIPLIVITASFSVISVILTVYDKYASKKRKKSRIPERILLMTAFLGGAAAEYITMKLIRHKTRHKKFMISLPLMAAAHIILFIWATGFGF